MITTTVDVSALAQLGTKMLTLQQADSLLREVSTSMLAVTRERIHEQGLNASGSQIGEYSDRYLKLRESNNLGTDRTVRLFFTGQMQNDYSVVDLSDTEYALGYQNQLNADKADWAEDRFGKIFALTDGELDQVRAIVSEFVTQAFK
jgi:hypothetical protein